MTDDLIELHLPPKAEYVPIVRALAGVIAGEMSFTYDEIVQIRVTVSELFEIAVRNRAQENAGHLGEAITLRFVLGPDKLELMVAVPEGQETEGTIVEEESLALLESLVDEFDHTSGAGQRYMLRIVKHRPAGSG